MFTGNENHDITVTEAAAMTLKYRQTLPATGGTLGGFFGEKAILQILSISGCIGIRYYYGLNSSNEKVLVLVGVDKDENDIITATGGGLCKELSVLCPPTCGADNVLNHG